jgi:hypothetical protein
VIHISPILVKLLQYSQRYSMVNHGDTYITHLGETVTVQSEIYHGKSR